MYYYQSFTWVESYVSYLQSVAAANVVINSIDLQAGCGVIGASWVTTATGGGFDYRLEAVPPAQVQATVAADGAEGRIVTATTFDDAAGNIVLISYGWQGDTTTSYEAKTLIAMPTDVQNQAITLAGEGYFISAFGGNNTDGYVLIGMRVQGDSLPRPITNGSTPKDSAYGTVVAWLSGVYGAPTIYEQ